MPLPSPVDIQEVVLVGLLNPVVLAVAAWLGWTSTEASKLIVAAFIASIVGIGAIALANALGVPIVTDVARASVGIFVFQIVSGYIVALLAYRLSQRRDARQR